MKKTIIRLTTVVISIFILFLASSLLTPTVQAANGTVEGWLYCGVDGRGIDGVSVRAIDSGGNNLVSQNTTWDADPLVRGTFSLTFSPLFGTDFAIRPGTKTTPESGFVGTGSESICAAKHEICPFSSIEGTSMSGFDFVTNKIVSNINVNCDATSGTFTWNETPGGADEYILRVNHASDGWIGGNDYWLRVPTNIGRCDGTTCTVTLDATTPTQGGNPFQSGDYVDFSVETIYSGLKHCAKVSAPFTCGKLPPLPPPCEGDRPRVVGRVFDTLTGSNRLWQPATDDYMYFSCGDQFATDINAEHTGTLTIYNAQGRDSDWFCGEGGSPAYFRRSSSCGEGPHLFRFFPPTGLTCEDASWGIDYPDACPVGCTGYKPPAGTITNGTGCEAIVYLGPGEWDNHLQWKLLKEPPPDGIGGPPGPLEPILQALFCNDQGGPTNDPATGEIYTAIGCISTNSIQLFTEFYITWAIGLGGGIAFALFIISGIMIVTSAGNEQRLKAGKQLLTAAIGGLLLLIFSAFILKVVAVDLLNIPGI